MDAITNDSNTNAATIQALQNALQSLQGVQSGNDSSTPKSAEETTQSEQSSGDAFSDFLKQSLGKTGAQEINEEEFYQNIIAAKLNEENPEAAAFYQEQVGQLSTSMARADGYIPVEDVAKAALKATVDAGKIEKEKAEIIHGQAFTGAQLDAVTEALYDGRGDTRAVASADEAMAKLQLFMEDIKAGRITVEARSLDAPSNVGPVGGGLEAEKTAEGEAVAGLEVEGEKSRKFSWKHVASDGNLAILIPSALSDGIESVEILNSDGEVVEKGKYSKRTGDNRAVYRFSDPGGEYGKDLDVYITKKNGDVITYHIPDGNKRTSEWLDDAPGAAAEKIRDSKKDLKKGEAEVSTTSYSNDSSTSSTESTAAASTASTTSSVSTVSSASSSTASASSDSSTTTVSEIQSPTQVL